MKALRLAQPEQLEWIELPECDPPAPHEILCETLAVGICGTDLHAWAGRQPMMQYPRILGHELAVQVQEVGSSVTHLDVGQTGAVEPFLNCGVCNPCRRGRANCCVNLQVLGVHVDGGLRPRFKIPAEKFHASERLTFSQLATTEPLTIGLHAVTRSSVVTNDRVLILGMGPIGMTLIPPLLEQSADLWIADINAFRLDHARQAFGLDASRCHQIPTNTPSETVVEGILNQVESGGFDQVFDATGFIHSMNQAPELAAHGGEVIFVGHTLDQLQISNPVFHRKELRVSASRNATAVDFSKVLRMMEDPESYWNRLNWITHRVAFEDALEWLPRFRDPETRCIKAVIEFTPQLR